MIIFGLLIIKSAPCRLKILSMVNVSALLLCMRSCLLTPGCFIVKVTSSSATCSTRLSQNFLSQFGCSPNTTFTALPAWPHFTPLKSSCSSSSLHSARSAAQSPQSEKSHCATNSISSNSANSIPPQSSISYCYASPKPTA
jgi:hypothetical protein